MSEQYDEEFKRKHPELFRLYRDEPVTAETIKTEAEKPFKDTAPEITKKQDDAVKAYQEDKVKAYLSKGPGSQMFKGQGGRNTGGLVSKPKTKTKTKKILGKKT